MSPGRLASEIATLLRRGLFEPIIEEGLAGARSAFSSRRFLAILADVDFLGGENSRETLNELAEHAPLVLAGQAATLEALAATPLSDRVRAFVPKPFVPEVPAFHMRVASRATADRDSSRASQRSLSADALCDHGTLEVVRTIVKALEAKDLYTLNHSRMVAHFASLTARAMNLPSDAVHRIRLAGLLHDVGMIAVRQEVLNKPGPLTLTEREHVNIHPVMSERILRPISALHDLLPVVRHHHERFDGAGYPDRLAGARIPRWSRILAVADAFDAIISVRAHRQPCSLEGALELIETESGTQFDPRVVASFVEVARRSRCQSARVLVIDDSPVDLHLAEAALQIDGHQVTTADGAAHAVRAISGQEFDLVIIDPVTRGSRGLQLARTIHKECPDTPMILCTEMPGLQDDIALWELEIAAFMQKPISSGLLRQEARRALSARSDAADPILVP